MTERPESPRTFRPVASRGWSWPLVIGLGGVVLLVTAVVPRHPQGTQAGVGALLAALGLSTAVAATRVRYEVTDGQLRLRAIPLVNARIPLSAIRSVERRDLQPTVWASIRFPGLALRRVRYVKVGPVYMCATRAAKGILVLDTDRGLFGVTPEDEQGFVRALQLGD